MAGGAASRDAKPRVTIDANAQLRIFLVIGIAAFFGGIVFHGTTVALPKIFEVRLGAVVDDLATIGVLVALVFAVAAVAQIVVGHLLDRVGARPLLPTVACCRRSVCSSRSGCGAGACWRSPCR